MGRKLKIYDSEEQMNSDANLPGQDDPPPAVKLEAFVRQHTGTTIRQLNGFQAANLLKKAAVEERDLFKAGLLEARPDLSHVFEAADEAQAVRETKVKREPESDRVAGNMVVRGGHEVALPQPPIELTPLAIAARTVPIKELRLSATNPRKTKIDDASLAELVQSIKSVGILQPLLVRNVDGKAEVVCGARRLRAAALAGLSEVPVIVRDLSDLAALECQIIENVQREDVTALEEADAYRTLQQPYGYSIEQIVEKTGKTRATIYARLKLASLCKRGREAMISGKLPATHALLIARIPGEKLQEQALAELIDKPSEVLSYRPFAETIGQRYTLDLKSASFDPDDDLLLPEAGSCKPCKFRSGNCPEVTTDIKSANVCTNPDCFALKVKAAADQKLAQLEAKGVQPLAKVDAKKLFAHGDELHWNADFVELDKPHPNDQKRRTWAQLLSKVETQDGKELERRAIVAPSGRVLTVVDRHEAEKLLKKLQGTAVAKKVQEDEDAKEERAKEKAAREVRDRVAFDVAKEAIARAKKKGIELPVLRILAKNLADELTNQEEPIAELAYEIAGSKDGSDFEKKIATKVENAELHALLTLAALALEGGFENHGGYNEAIKGFAKICDLDLRAMEKDAKTWIQVEAETAKEKAKRTKGA